MTVSGSPRPQVQGPLDRPSTAFRRSALHAAYTLCPRYETPLVLSDGPWRRRLRIVAASLADPQAFVRQLPEKSVSISRRMHTQEFLNRPLDTDRDNAEMIGTRQP